MYRKIKGFFSPEQNVLPVSFGSNFRLEYQNNTLLIAGKTLPEGTSWPGTARQRRIIQALNEKNMQLMNCVVPLRRSSGDEKEEMHLEISVTPSGTLFWELDVETGIMRIFDRSGMEVFIAAEGGKTDSFLFRTRQTGAYRLFSDSWDVREEKGIFCCAEKTFFEKLSLSTEELWQQNTKRNYRRWSEILPAIEKQPLNDKMKTELVTAVVELFAAPEEQFFFDGNFACRCAALRKLKLAEPLKEHLMKICRFTPVWQQNSKCFTGIDDGIRVPRRCDAKGDALEMDWLIALDASFSCLAGCEMFDYCNSLHDMDFLQKYAFRFMEGVMRTVELSIIPDNYDLQLPYAPLPGGRADTLESAGKNVDRQLFFIRKLAEKCCKAAEMLQIRPDPVWQDILQRLPRARGDWSLTPDTQWGRAGEKIVKMFH